MILNVWTVSALFLAGVGGVLAASTFALAVRGLLRRSSAPTAAERSSAEDGGHLLLLLVLVLTGVRLIAWPHFYWVLESYVPDLSVFGVMCSFGVTQIDPERVRALEILKPVALLVAGYWFVVGHALGGAEGARVRLVWALPVSALLLADCLLEGLYLLAEKSARPMTCCTQFLDTESAASIANSNAFGLRAGALGGAYAALLGLGIAGALWLLRARRTPAPAPASLPGAGLALLALIGPASIAATFLAWPAIIAPRVLGLPYHHCLYELLTGTPAFGLAALAAVAGGGALVGPFLLRLQGARESERIAAVQRTLLRFAAVALASEALLVVLHLI